MTDFTRENLLTAKNTYTRLIDVIENVENLQYFEYDRAELKFLKDRLIDRTSVINRVLKREFEDDFPT